MAVDLLHIGYAFWLDRNFISSVLAVTLENSEQL